MLDTSKYIAKVTRGGARRSMAGTVLARACRGYLLHLGRGALGLADRISVRHGWVACTHVGRRTATLSSYVYHEIPFPIWGKDIDEPGAAVRARVRSGSAHGDFGCGGAVPRIRVSETHLLCVVPHLHL